MPGKTWKDLQKDSAHSIAERPSLRANNEQNSDNNNATNTIFEKAKQESPQLSKLLEKRQALEDNLRNLSAGENNGLDSREAAKYQIPSFAQRQAQQRQWELEHEQQRINETQKRQQARATHSLSRPTNNTTNPFDSNSSRSSVNQWLARRDTQRQALRDASRDRLSPLNDAAKVGRQLGNSLSNSSSQLRDLDKQLAEQGMDEERDELRQLGGGGALGKMKSTVDKFSSMAEAPMGAVNKIDNFWKKRQQDISGPMDRVGAYSDTAKRRLSTRMGGSGDLFERMERNRQAALKARQEKRNEEARDEARRKRAQSNKAKKNTT